MQQQPESSKLRPLVLDEAEPEDEADRESEHEDESEDEAENHGADEGEGDDWDLIERGIVEIQDVSKYSNDLQVIEQIINHGNEVSFLTFDGFNVYDNVNWCGMFSQYCPNIIQMRLNISSLDGISKG